MPLLVTAVICNPLERPYSAWYTDVRTLTSAIDSTFIWSRGRLLPVSITPTPSIMMLVSPPPPIRVGSPVGVTPGASDASAVKLRFAIGRFSTELVAIVKERSPLDAWMADASALTETVSEATPSSRVRSPTEARVPGFTETPDRFRVLNDPSVTSTVYVSAATLTNTKSPLAPVTTGADVVPRVSLVSVTVAPGMTAPWGSLTVPSTVPVVSCARTGGAIVSSTMSAATRICTLS